MQAFKNIKSSAVPLPMENIDTDQIIPARFLKATTREGFGENLFRDWRYSNDGKPNENFVLNNPTYSGQILVAGKNFGCGSSREHAPWALEDFGIRCVIAPSFADIFYNNCFKNGILPIVLDVAVVAQLFDEMYAAEGYQLAIDLAAQTVTTASGEVIGFEVDEFRKYCLLNGLDDIGLTLQDADAIKQFEQQWQVASPWLFQQITR